MNKLKAQNGIAAILTVIIISASVLILAVGGAYLSLNGLDMAFVYNKQNEARSIAEGCVEEILRQIQMDNDFMSSDFNLSLGDGTCAASVAISGNNRTIISEGTVGDYSNKVKLEIELIGNRIIINSWDEISG